MDSETPLIAPKYVTVADLEYRHERLAIDSPIGGDETTRWEHLLAETAGKQRRDAEQRSEWRHHRGIPIEWPDVYHDSDSIAQ